MYLLSFDIGIKNLAFCYSQDTKVIEWDVFDISGDSVNDTCEKCMLKLEEAFANKLIDKVLIENQPVQKNPTMKTIQIVVFSYFLYKKAIRSDGIEGIHFVSASKKNKLAKSFDVTIPDGGSAYSRAKKMSVKAVASLIENTEWESFFNSHKKKDDLADSYLQLLSYIDFKPVQAHQEVLQAPVLPNPPSPREVDSSDSTSTTSQQEILVKMS